MDLQVGAGSGVRSSAAAAGLPLVPAAFFGMVLGLVGLGGSWRAAHALWGVPAAIGEALMLAGTAVWAAVTVLFALKWIFARDKALEEAAHPVQCCFIGLAGVATLLVSLAAGPYSRPAALGLLGLGALFTLGFALWRTGLLWRGERDPAHTTPVLYLPTVAGSYVTAIACGALGFTDWGQLAFGAGVFSWLAIESVLLGRLYTASPLAPALRPTLGIQLAPPTVGALAYLSVTQGPPDIFARALLGYGLLQSLLLLRLLPWILRQPLSPGYWAFTFGCTAFATAALRLVERGETGAVALLAPVLLAGATLVVAITAAHSLWQLVNGRLLPTPAPSPAATRS
ncbi:dicarboxylate transporter/tellurite-resistance protein TehA [Ancylobacter oerskovii]|uniref:Dicarboxylate transporter/tellurite-resistance protein TehA n=1 Tax=Ancylobacter oerskovii TaxID=459519 RepID=A0ABW4YZ19_9HYPH|nr:dicarboxylate transporter/tellurite-resistance protein TehA [Ancylobacter oerskovii]MBS7541672.1 dicarboxylate transporter/tellurite-resistance protein TehA [Ancylobacter oerskovii]